MKFFSSVLYLRNSQKVWVTIKLSNVLDRPRWKSQTIQTFFHGTDVKYFAVIDNNPPPSHSDKMNLLNQMLESAKLKDKELRSERDIVKEDKGKTENSPWLGRMDWKRMFLGRDMKRLVVFVERSWTFDEDSSGFSHDDWQRVMLIHCRTNDEFYFFIF